MVQDRQIDRNRRRQNRRRRLILLAQQQLMQLLREELAIAQAEQRVQNQQPVQDADQNEAGDPPNEEPPSQNGHLSDDEQ